MKIKIALFVALLPIASLVATGTAIASEDVLALDNLSVVRRPANNLLAVSWFDNFGIQRMAVDRGLLDEADKLEGVFVILLEGEPL